MLLQYFKDSLVREQIFSVKNLLQGVNSLTNKFKVKNKS